MAKKSNIVTYSTEQLAAMIARGEDRTDWARVNATSEAELEASILADPDDVHEGLDWTKAVQGIPLGKEHINLRVDHDVMQWFRSNGKGYEALMNNVLRDYVESKRFAS